ncbi:polyprenyl synthetase family protein [Aurantimonas sp. Leaf443]|uniref:polyprenyl synthetase family protein n=1 Tax=Aurantimonas sp. Leaf443 TaxID=1736378 RepID=UPI0006F58E6C|nr:farnesyl diphosphate synthase [Aurantimonas sp. Leaf443]KQT85172.1 hypothetical protein ASG48_07820 [Aurantimonas sp. Leaf443]
MASGGFEAFLEARADEIETALGAALDPASPLLSGTPERLLAAMRYAALGGGKRLRPVLLAEVAALLGAPRQAALGPALALECIHCYSLVHDDLPAMDDDDLRRGRPTVHRAFDEATAILAGDALLTLAFGLVAAEATLAAQARVALVAALARAAGAAGMVGGQALDLGAETLTLSESEIATMQAMKTGALIAQACEAGAIVAGADAETRDRLVRYGEIVGLAFQLADDLLDETSDAATLGKAAGKDAARGKKTLPSLHGQDWTRRRLDALVAEAEALLAPFGDRARTLVELARFVAIRSR